MAARRSSRRVATRTALPAMWTAMCTAMCAAISTAACTAERPVEAAPPKAVRARPGPSPQTRPPAFDVVSENEACVRCHADVAAEWRGSLHRRSWSDPVFLSAYSVEPLAFCRDCHAPEAGGEGSRPAPDGPRADAARDVGVGCVTCHVLDTAIVGHRALPDRPGAHAVVASERIGTSEWCRDCHEFDFPVPQAAQMQSTVREHASSRHADQSCQDCHMPQAGARRRHTFAVQGDAALLRSALHASARQTGARTIEVELRVADAGHDVPTGDMFRRLVVRATMGDAAAEPRVLARRFRKTATADGARRLQTGDDRLSATGEPTVVSLLFLQPIAEAVDWEVVYQRMGPYEAALFGVDIAAEEVVVARGQISGERNP